MTALAASLCFVVMCVGARLAGTANGRRVLAATRPGYDQGLSGPLFLAGAALAAAGGVGFVWAVLA